MKKYTKSGRHLNYIRKRARKSLAARLRFQRYKRQKNRVENYLSSIQQKTVREKRVQKADGYAFVIAPAILSFVRFPNEVSGFIAELRQFENKKRPVHVVLKHVKEIDYDGITVLLSAVVRFQARRIAFNGDLPDDQTARTTILDSGFFNYIRDYKFKDEDHYELTATKIYTHAKKNVDPLLGEKIIEGASRVIWNGKKRCPGVQRVILELMQNTNNHASFESAGKKHWWLSVKYIKDERKVTFSFVDYGVGVFKSLRSKKPNEKFYGVFDQIYEKAFKGLTGNGDSTVLPLIFEGELHRTITGKTYRGKGLPGIYQALKRGQISNLAMITNQVVFDSAKNICEPLLVPFEGTFVYWEVNYDSHHID